MKNKIFSIKNYLTKYLSISYFKNKKYMICKFCTSKNNEIENINFNGFSSAQNLNEKNILEYRKYIQMIFNIRHEPSITQQISLEKFKHALDYYKINYEKMKYIHVAGTNGKGSVSHKLEKVLLQENIKVGLFTSPHINSATERIRVNGNNIDIVFFTEVMKKIIKDIEQKNININFFGIMCLVMLSYFIDKKVEIAIIEAGVGGRYDCTNFIDPILSVITSISLDHQQTLGFTVDEIAWHKAGIIKSKRPVVLGHGCSNTLNVFYNEAKLKNSEVILSSEGNTYDQENINTTINCIKLLNINQSKQEIILALKSKPSCRFEEISYKGKKIIFDVAHNEDGFKKVIDQLKGNSSISYIIAISKYRDSNYFISLINSNDIYLTTTENYKLAEIHELEKYSKNNKVKGYGSVDTVMKMAIKSKNEVIVILGSFYVMKEARQFIGIKEFCDF